MNMDLPTKVQAALWWITSIATSVLCCSVLFVLFATYFVDLRNVVKDMSDNMSVIEAREDRILAEIEMIRKRAVLQPVQASANQVSSDVAVEAPVTLSVSGPNPNKETEVAPVDVSVPSVPAVLPSMAPAAAPSNKK